MYQDERPFVSAKKVMWEMGEPYRSHVELLSFHTVSKVRGCQGPGWVLRRRGSAEGNVALHHTDWGQGGLRMRGKRRRRKGRGKRAHAVGRVGTVGVVPACWGFGGIHCGTMG